jgi:cytochrome c
MNKLLSVALVAASLLASPAFASGDAEAGKKVFKKCVACHTIDGDTKKKSGPSLDGLYGRTAGTLEGFKYSKAMVAAGAEGWIWTAETFENYLTNPKTAIPKNKMAFAGLKKEDDIKNIEAYLLTFSPDYVEADDDGDDGDDDKKSD